MGVVGIVVEMSSINREVVQALNGSDRALYLVDEGGYVVASSSVEDNTTSFLGAWQPNLFDQLVNDSVFSKQVITGYHKRICSSTNSSSRGTGSAGYRLTVSSYTVLPMESHYHFPFTRVY